MTKKIIGTTWFSEMGSTRPIGIVTVLDEITGEYKAFIGTGSGHNEDADARSIISMGAKFHPSMAKDILRRLGGQAVHARMEAEGYVKVENKEYVNLFEYLDNYLSEALKVYEKGKIEEANLKIELKTIEEA